MSRTATSLSVALLTIQSARADTLDVYTCESFFSEWGLEWRRSSPLRTHRLRS